MSTEHLRPWFLSALGAQARYRATDLAGGRVAARSPTEGFSPPISVILFGALPLIRIASLGAILVVAVVLGKGLVETVANGTYQIRQMVITGALRAKMEPGMWLRLFSDIKTWPKAQTFFFTKDKEGGESGCSFLSPTKWDWTFQCPRARQVGNGNGVPFSFIPCSGSTTEVAYAIT